MTKSEAEIRYNRTTRFLLPALRLNDDALIAMGLVNAYLTDHEYDVRWDYEKCLYLLFKPAKFNEEFEQYCSLIRQLPLYRDEYDIGEGVVIVLKIPEKYESIIDQFKKGKYSKFDKAYVKECIPQFVGGRLSKRWKIFYKDRGVREEIENEYKIEIGDGEVEDIPYAQDEILRYNKDINTDLTTRNDGQ